MIRTAHSHAPGALPQRQRGLVLFIALIVLVAMTIAGIAIMRSVDTSNLVSGNMAFRQGTINSADGGLDAAYTFLITTKNNSATVGNLDADMPSEGYYSSVSDPPPARPGDPPDWTANDVWADAKTVGTDGAGNTIQYVIHRMCRDPNRSFGNNDCAQRRFEGARNGDSARNSGGGGAPPNTSEQLVYFRVTVRVRGPRETLSVAQSTIGLWY